MKLVAFSLFIAGSLASLDHPRLRHDQDFTKSMKDICSENGYSWEKHIVTTKDGYINTVFRIPGK